MALELHAMLVKTRNNNTLCFWAQTPLFSPSSIATDREGVASAEVWHVGVEVSFSASHTAGRFACAPNEQPA